MSFSEENRKHYNSLHKSILLLGWILVPIIFVLEIILLITGAHQKQYMTGNVAIKLKVILPTIIDFTVMIGSTIILSSEKIHIRVKNWCSTFLIFILCSVVSVFHSDFIFLVLLPCFVIQFSTMFADVLLTIITSVCSGLVILPSLILAMLQNGSDNIAVVASGIAGLGIFVCGVLISQLMLKNSQEQKALIRKYCVNQEELIDELQVEPMTGLSNRKSMNDALLRYIQEYHEGKCIPHLVLMDIDHFKHVNDTFGHNAGDAVIKNLASIIRRNMNGVRNAFRFGGDEMVIVFGNESLDEIKDIIENIRNEFKSTRYNFHPDEPITLSVGCAPFYKGLNQKTWFELADAVMYKSKEGGRDTVSFADE